MIKEAEEKEGRGGEQNEREEKVREEEPGDERKHDESEEEEEDPTRSAFFDCKVDREASCKDDFVRAQEGTTSKCMTHVRAHLDRWAHNIFYTVQNGLFVAKREREE